MKKSALVSLLLVVAMLMTLFVGCGAKEEPAPAPAEKPAEAPAETPAETPAEAPADEPVRIAYCTQQLSNEFMQSLKDAVVGACEAQGYEVEVFSADLDPAKQINQIETAVNQGFDGIILDPANADAVIPGVQYAQEAGVPIVTMHEDVTGNVADATSKSDFKEGGILKMQHCVDSLGGEGRIAIINGALGQTATTNIRAGYQEVLDANPGIEVVFEDAGDWSTEPAIKLMESWLSTGEELDAVIGMNDAMALGVISVLEAAGKEGILVYGLDAQTEMKNMIKEGRATATILTDLKGEAAGAVAAITSLLNGETVDKINIVPMVCIDINNVDEYMNY